MIRPNGKVLCAVLVTLVASLAAPSLVWAAKGSLVVDGSTATDTSVVVRVANTGAQTQTGVLTVTAVVDGEPVTAVRTVTVEGRQAAYLSVHFGSDVDLVLTVKMTDGDSPVG